MDARLRQLERALRSGDPALLRERLRAGMLSPDDLWLAAHLGHSGARELLGEEAPAVRDDLSDWVDDLLQRGLAVAVALAAAEAVLPAFARVRPDDARPSAALAMARAPSEHRSTKVVIEARMAAEEVGHGPPHWAALAAHWAGAAARGERGAPGQAELDAWAAIDAAVRALGEAEVRAAIALALLPDGLRDLVA